MWELARAATTKPPLELVESWVKKISEHLYCLIHFSAAVYKTLSQRSSYLKSTLKQKYKGKGRQRKEFVESAWIFRVQRTDLSSHQDLKEEVAKLSDEVRSSTRLVHRLQKENSDKRGKRKSTETYSDRHLRRLKNVLLTAMFPWIGYSKMV